MKILNFICLHDKFIEEEEIKKHILNEDKLTDEHFLKLMNLLWDDHYLTRKIEYGKRTYKFKYSILCKWWKINRG